MLLASDQRRVRYVPLEIVQSLERECKLAGGLQQEIQGGLGFIYPGTKWCGPGKLFYIFSTILDQLLMRFKKLSSNTE